MYQVAQNSAVGKIAYYHAVEAYEKVVSGELARPGLRICFLDHLRAHLKNRQKVLGDTSNVLAARAFALHDPADYASDCV